MSSRGCSGPASPPTPANGARTPGRHMCSARRVIESPADPTRSSGTSSENGCSAFLRSHGWTGTFHGETCGGNDPAQPRGRALAPTRGGVSIFIMSFSTTTTPRLAGRRALVTGGGSGIGRASALRLAAEGAKVAVADVRAGAPDPVAAEVAAAGGCALPLVCDVRDEASVQAATTAAAEAFDGLDTVVACAGIAASGSTASMALADWELMIGVNLTGVFLTVKHALPHLVAAGGGAIVTIGSTASLVAAGRTSSYDASKGGVLQFTRAVAVEYVDEG